MFIQSFCIYISKAFAYLSENRAELFKILTCRFHPNLTVLSHGQTKHLSKRIITETDNFENFFKESCWMCCVSISSSNMLHMVLPFIKTSLKILPFENTVYICSYSSESIVIFQMKSLFMNYLKDNHFSKVPAQEDICKVSYGRS